LLLAQPSSDDNSSFTVIENRRPTVPIYLIPLHRIVGSPGIRREHDAITLFKSLGVGLEDLAIASLLYDRAVASGRLKPL
jgi:hypothetical protein